jgi:hypothetical protein
VAKTDLSMQMRKILEDDGLSDDVKIKLYRRTLDRFLNVSDSAPVVERQSATNALSPINIPPATKQKKRRRKQTDWVTF